MRRFVEVLRNIFIKTKIEYEELILHYQINMLYNVLLDDVEDKLNYTSDIILNIINSSHGIKLNSKEKVIVALLKFRFLRKTYRMLTLDYRNGKGMLYKLSKKIR